MKTKTVKNITIVLSAFAVFAFASTANAQSAQARVGNRVCTQEVKQCPNGKYVGKSGPNCEFRSCDSIGKHILGAPHKFIKEVRAIDKENRDAWRAKRHEVRQGAVKFRGNLKAERKELRAKVRGFVSTHMQQVLKRLTAMYERLTKINTRLQSHLDKLVANGVDTTSAQKALDTARERVASAKESVLGAKAVIEEATSAEKPAEYRAKIRETVKGAIASVKEAKRAIRVAIKEAKNAKTNTNQ